MQRRDIKRRVTVGESSAKHRLGATSRARWGHVEFVKSGWCRPGGDGSGCLYGRRRVFDMFPRMAVINMCLRPPGLVDVGGPMHVGVDRCRQCAAEISANPAMAAELGRSGEPRARHGWIVVMEKISRSSPGFVRPCRSLPGSGELARLGVRSSTSS